MSVLLEEQGTVLITIFLLVRNLAIQQNQPKQQEGHYHSRSSDSKTSDSIALSKYGDDTTTDGNDTLLEWSVADNAPSIGSAGELFSEKMQKKKSSSKRRFFQSSSGYASSSDEEDDDYDDGDKDESEDPISIHF